jgi:hemerythrin HHE cation binding domain-containing protein
MLARTRVGTLRDMSQVQFREQHEVFRAWTDELRAAARIIPELDAAARFALVADLVAFLQEKIEPHTHVDEQVLYPKAAARLGSPLATAAMAYDHLAIRSWIAKLSEADEDDVATLQELLYGLDALIRVHLWKEDELMVRPLESPGWPASAA